MRWWLKVIMVLAAIGILFVSFIRAGLEKVNEDERFDRLRKISIAYVDSRGENRCYRLPESGLLPNNILYPIKEFRDNLWIYLNRDRVDKLRITLLINDKRLEEVLLLKGRGRDQIKIEKQLKKIKEKMKDLENDSRRIIDNKPEIREIKRKIDTASEFYGFIYQKIYQNDIIENCYE